ncbi:TIGR02302 family protein [Ferruginivarius sediminum]|uniref:TIGR02302 family protein n=1 Tax=Ferruginivarius sediminum TaxID=2661937 RepID=A0A369TCB2_9PROT|nr:TIGR02302 family protein [Ferruginivarius sediminum]RDD62918.1 TIGR02302 family protein [Ferruginivarius sediminum]
MAGTTPNGGDRQDTVNDGAMPRGLTWRLRLAWAAVAWERVWPRLWPAAAVLALFLAAALLGILPWLGAWMHLFLLVAFAAAFASTLVHGMRGLRWPRAEDARRRLERDSGLRHRPLSGLDDVLAAGKSDPEAAALWQAHQARLRRLLGRLRVALPRGSLAALDPRALRAVPVLLLAAGLIAAGTDAPNRLVQAATPQLAGPPAPRPQLDVWVDPPAYTGQAPRFIATGTDAEPVLRTPTGSRLLAQLQGGEGAPHLLIGKQETGFQRVADQAWKAETKLDVNAGLDLAVRQDGGTLAAWDLQVVPDAAPEIAFRMPPQQGRRNALRIDYTAEDDYGVQTVRLRVERPGDDRVEPIVRELPLPAGDAKAENASYHDFTAHVWAGVEVRITLEAEDALGQTGHSDTVTTVLPQRTFQHPVARKLVELRRQLTLEPGNRYPVVQGLSRLQDHPAHFFGDFVVALAMRSAERRLVYDKTDTAVTQAQELMWRTALRIEEGEIAVAERDLRRAEQALMEALSRDNASDAELQHLMDELESAMNRFLEALAERMRQQLAEGQQPQPVPPDAQVLETRDLREMMQQMRDMAQSGARDAARDMLARMQEMMENLSRQPMMSQMSEQNRRAMEMMRQMRSLSEQQQELLDNSFQRQQQMRREGMRQGEGQRQGQMQQGQQQAQPGERSGQPQGMRGMQSDAEQQEALRRRLGQMMRELGDMLGQIPQPMGQAEQDMRDATGALRGGQPDSAIQPQTDALDNLQQGMQAMREAIQQQMQAEQPGRGEGQGEFGWSPGQRRDPLGRSRDNDGQGQVDTGDVKVPDQMDLQRAREILDELRRRSGDRARPELELDYIERLLQRF